MSNHVALKKKVSLGPVPVSFLLTGRNWKHLFMLTERDNKKRDNNTEPSANYVRERREC